jgi:hypothetical protein
LKVSHVFALVLLATVATLTGGTESGFLRQIKLQDSSSSSEYDNVIYVDDDGVIYVDDDGEAIKLEDSSSSEYDDVIYVNDDGVIYVDDDGEEIKLGGQQL